MLTISTEIKEQLKTLRYFINPNQLIVMVGLKELKNTFSYLLNIISTMPKVYEQEELEREERKFYLHYFTASSDFYISEKDLSNKQLQAYGFVCFNGDKQNAEFGYISIDELIKNGVEMDLHFEPCLQKDILQKFKD